MGYRGGGGRTLRALVSERLAMMALLRENKRRVENKGVESHNMVVFASGGGI